MTAEALLIELRTSRTDLARLVEAAVDHRRTRLVVPQRSVEAWERREPETWTKVSGWLTARYGARWVVLTAGERALWRPRWQDAANLPAGLRLAAELDNAFVYERTP